jgi:hypothetical protein
VLRQWLRRMSADKKEKIKSGDMVKITEQGSAEFVAY